MLAGGAAYLKGSIQAWRRSGTDTLYGPAMASGYSSAAGERYAIVSALIQGDVAPPATVVELGAAPGEQAVGLARLGYRVTAVDLGVASDDWDGVATGTMETRFREAGIDLVRWDLERVPYPLPSGGFDVVVMTEVFEHLRDYPATSLHEVRRILRPGGRLYFSTPNAAYAGNRLKLLFGRTVMTPLPDWVGGVPHARHAREYTVQEVRVLMRDAGLEPILVTSRHPYVHSGRTGAVALVGKRVIDLVARARPTLGPLTLVVARRPM